MIALNVIGFVVDLMVKSPVIWTLYNPSLVFPINLDDLILNDAVGKCSMSKKSLDLR